MADSKAKVEIGRAKALFKKWISEGFDCSKEQLDAELERRGIRCVITRESSIKKNTTLLKRKRPYDNGLPVSYQFFIIILLV